MTERKHIYVATSERGFWDETDIQFYTDKECEIGEWFTDGEGLQWLVTEVIK